MMTNRKRPASRIRICFLVLLLTVGAVSNAHGQVAQKSYVNDSHDQIYRELNGIDKNLHREIRETIGSTRVTTSVDRLKIKYDLSPRNYDCPVYFGQPSVQSHFSEMGLFRGRSLEDMVEKLKTGVLKPDAIPIQFIWVDGKKVTVNNRSLTVLYKAGMRPTKLIDRTNNLPLQGRESLEEVLQRLETMGGKPSTEMLVRRRGLGRDGQPKEASDWDAPIAEIVHMPDDLLKLARSCEKVDDDDTHGQIHSNFKIAVGY
jgi:hypothetical protein